VVCVQSNDVTAPRARVYFLNSGIGKFMSANANRNTFLTNAILNYLYFIIILQIKSEIAREFKSLYGS